MPLSGKKWKRFFFRFWSKLNFADTRPHFIMLGLLRKMFTGLLGGMPLLFSLSTPILFIVNTLHLQNASILARYKSCFSFTVVLNVAATRLFLYLFFGLELLD
ncbi:hypothetical protein Cni_G16379 [Canna indica]|uniref:Uncharacterized protein n=1 Tax=Canna indica TaxID=4628 RepID=A0AAQ3QE49_9LILI|nr:hypothetical protein Cni_G16379 [Canna indica]